MKRIFVTGGHFTPAKAVVDLLLKNPKLEIFYIGRKFATEGDSAISLEYQQMAHHQKVKFLEITAGRPQRRLGFRSIISYLKIPIGFLQSFYFLLRFRPQLILSFGGYVAIPVAIIGWLLKIPVVNHEQVIAFGKPSKLLSLISKKQLVSFRELVQNKSTKWLFTGNPVREDIFIKNFDWEIKNLLQIKSKSKLPLIYITGGSQGAHIINTSILERIEDILEKSLVIWQTGDSKKFNDFDRINNFLKSLPENIAKRVLVKKFINPEEIGGVLNSCDFVIGRSGANTVFELLATAKPAVLIPIPWVHDNEQLKNAQLLEKLGTAIVVMQTDNFNLSSQALISGFEKMLSNLNEYKNSANKNRNYNPSDAAQKIVFEVEKLLN